jgi:hypothetical protein
MSEESYKTRFERAVEELSDYMDRFGPALTSAWETIADAKIKNEAMHARVAELTCDNVALTDRVAKLTGDVAERDEKIQGLDLECTILSCKAADAHEVCMGISAANDDMEEENSRLRIECARLNIVCIGNGFTSIDGFMQDSDPFTDIYNP